MENEFRIYSLRSRSKFIGLIVSPFNKRGKIITMRCQFCYRDFRIREPSHEIIVIACSGCRKKK